MKLGKKGLENTDTLDFFQINQSLWAYFPCNLQDCQMVFQSAFLGFFLKMEEEKDISSGQIKYLIQKKKGAKK